MSESAQRARRTLDGVPISTYWQEITRRDALIDTHHERAERFRAALEEIDARLVDLPAFGVLGGVREIVREALR